MSRQTAGRAVWIGITVLVMAVIFLLSSQSSTKSEDMSDMVARMLRVDEALKPEQIKENTRVSNQTLFAGLTLRKMAHVFLFCCLGFSMAMAMRGWHWRIPGAAALSYLYAVTDEWHQQWSGRHGRWEDTLIDLAGILIGIALAVMAGWIARRLRKKREKRESRKEEA